MKGTLKGCAMKSFTAVEIGQHCSKNSAVARQISEHILWDFEQWRTNLQDHINLPRAQDYVPNLELRQIEEINNLRLNDFITNDSIHSIDAAAIIALTVQTHVLGHLISWLDTLNADEQQFHIDVVLRWCKLNNLTLADDRCTPALITPPVVVASDSPAQRDRKPSWATVAMPYMKLVFSQGKYKSAAVFYRAMLSRADTQDSPFTKLKGELYCPEAGTTVSVGSMGTKWRAIRAL
jgi:hypothetical protein